jgi:hypothetical protein
VNILFINVFQQADHAHVLQTGILSPPPEVGFEMSAGYVNVKQPPGPSMYSDYYSGKQFRVALCMHNLNFIVSIEFV